MESNYYVLLAGAFLALLFFYAPGFKPWYDKKTPEEKQAINLVLILLAVAIDYGLKVYKGSVVFGLDSILAAVGWFVLAITANAGTYVSFKYLAGGEKTKG